MFRDADKQVLEEQWGCCESAITPLSGAPWAHAVFYLISSALPGYIHLRRKKRNQIGLSHKLTWRRGSWDQILYNTPRTGAASAWRMMLCHVPSGQLGNPNHAEVPHDVPSVFADLISGWLQKEL